MMRAWIDWEDRANKISDWSATFVPGLAQTPDYVRAVMASWTSDPSDVNARVAARLARQAILTRPSLTYDLLIDESALRRPVGGPEVMAAQIRHLIELSQRSTVTVQIVPTELGSHIGMVGSFIAVQFNTDEPSLVQIEHIGSAVILEDPAEVDMHLDALSTLAASALSPARTAELMRHIAAEYAQEQTR